MTVILTEVRIDFLYEVRTVLIASIDSPFQGQCLDGIDMGIADNILIMPLNGVDPTFQIETVVDAFPLVWIMDRGINIIRQEDGTVKKVFIK